jgi:hypothetical protein
VVRSRHITARIVSVGVASCAIASAYELSSRLIFPQITIWESHVITVAITTAFAVTLAYLIARKWAASHDLLLRKADELKRMELALTIAVTAYEGSMFKVAEQRLQRAGENRLADR